MKSNSKLSIFLKKEEILNKSRNGEVYRKILEKKGKWKWASIIWKRYWEEKARCSIKWGSIIIYEEEARKEKIEETDKINKKKQ